MADMTKAAKKHFVRQLINNVRNEIIDQIDTGALPEHWTGIELRWLIADRFEACAYVKNRRLRRAFNNEVAIHNL